MPHPVVDQVPRDQENLQLAIGRKFLGALRHFENIHLDGLDRGSEPADLICQSPGGDGVQVQIVEVIDQRLRELRHMRSSYRDALLATLRDDLRFFGGCRVSLVDSGDSPYLPSVNSQGGRESLRILAEHIRAGGAEAATLLPRKRRLRKTRTMNPEREVGVLVERVLPAGESLAVEFNWTGGGPSYQIDVPRGLLPAAVQSKIEKRYGKPASGSFLLLAYSVDTLYSSDDPDISEARRLLESSRHPFDEVWFLYPYAGQDLGSLIKVWSASRDG